MENRILIIKTGALGDVLRTTVLLEGLIEKYVHPKITWITKRNAAPILQNNPYIDELYFEDELPTDLFSRAYTLVISLEENPDLLRLLMNVRCKKWFGVYLDDDGKVSYTPNASMWYDMSLISQFPKDVADKLKKANLFSYPELLYKMLGLRWNNQRYRLFLIKRDLTYAQNLKKMIDVNRPVLGIFVGGGERWKMKALPQDMQERLIDEIQDVLDDKVQILLLTGSPDLELGLVTQLKAKFRAVLTHDVQDLEQFIGVIHLCDVIVSADSLAMHIGIALNKFVVAYFTVTSAHEIELYTGVKVVAKHPDACSYIKDLKPRPNITDMVRIDEIVASIQEGLRRGS